MKPRLIALIALILSVAFARLLPHPPNFAPVMALALFGGAYFANRRLAFVVPLVAMILSDLVLGLHSQIPFVYGSLIAVVLLGRLLQTNKTIGRLGLTMLSGSLLFFVVTNFGVWAFDQLYPRTFAGLVTCYITAIPFLHTQMAGDLFFTVLLFGGFALIERSIPATRTVSAS